MAKHSMSISKDNLRIEVAILQESIDAYDPPVKGKFTIPVLMTSGEKATISTGTSNILNKRNGNIKSSTINIDNTIDLYLPIEYCVTYGADKIPSGTRFLVSFVSGNLNDIRIVGRYDSVNDSSRVNIIKQMLDDIESLKDSISNS